MSGHDESLLWEEGLPFCIDGALLRCLRMGSSIRFHIALSRIHRGLILLQLVLLVPLPLRDLFFRETSQSAKHADCLLLPLFPHYQVLLQDSKLLWGLAMSGSLSSFLPSPARVRKSLALCLHVSFSGL